MPYDSNANLPDNLQHILPEHAQDIYREAFNHLRRPSRRPAAGGGGAPHRLGRREAKLRQDRGGLGKAIGRIGARAGLPRA